MKLKRFFVGLCAVAFCVAAQAQDVTKPVLTVEEFSGNASKEALNALRNGVIAGVQHSGRVEVIDIHNEAALKAEQSRREREEAMGDAGRVEEMGSLMSNAILRGTLDKLVVTRSERTDSDGKRRISYTANIAYTLAIINAKNGTLAASKVFEQTGYGDTEQEAFSSVLTPAEKPLTRFINNAYKAEGKILAIAEDDGKKAKAVYINLGSNDGVKKGQKVEIFKEINIDGEISKKLIGEAKIEEVMSAKRTLCKVNKGGDVVLREFGNGTKMPVKTKEEKAGFFDF